MEHPVRDIRGVIRSLAQGTPAEQQETINRYFLPSASFTHPFVRVPSFANKTVPLLGEVNSRMLILAIYKWYKLLSPQITLQIESTVFDQRANLLYVTLSQTFSLWFLPFHKSPVRLVTLLHLVPEQQQPSSNSHSNTNAIKNGTASSPDLPALGDAPTEPSFAEVASLETDTALEAEKATKVHTRLAPSSTASSPSGTSSESRKYRIAQQEDLYQVNEFIKFVLMTPGAMVWGWFQLVSAVWCVIGVLVLGLVGRVFGMGVGRAREVKEEVQVRVEQGMPLMGMFLDGDGEKKVDEAGDMEEDRKKGNGSGNGRGSSR